MIPERLWLNELRFWMERPEAWGVLAAVFLLSVYFLFAVFSTGGKKQSDRPPMDDVLLVDGGNGNIRVAVLAVQGLSARAARSVRGVREAKAKISPTDTGVSVNMGLVILPGMSAPEIGQSVAAEIRREIAESLNLSDVGVDVSINDISNAPVDKKQRVL